ncbi:uncharacterized protein N7484_001925 [Penicillium longicatenatum]|uniref:uncharacterized protein n=1 Tax=Penicillium longicatenatum TaxID=1561947 RepID=UPI002548FAB2|nr:uncharacterized protein N7484_001925 [Penicillium longicatenatum]KAJ5658276.1 hypothetical protein N7484_001925 [Penicillium longicatenatum]
MNSIILSSSETASVDNPIDPEEDRDYDTHYHHPVWPQRWYHPEFTKEAAALWCEEPWYKDIDRQSRRFLRSSLCNFPWGHIIYRTTYTPESEKSWPIAMEKLTRVMHEWIDGELENPRNSYGNDSRPEQLVKESHKDVIISDSSRWDGASVEQVRSHYMEHLREMKQERCGEQPRFVVCLMIDERSLKSIVAKDDYSGFVGVVDGWYLPGIKYDWPSYRGYMRAEVAALWPLYQNLDFNHMDDVFLSVADGFIPVYDAGS